MSVRGAIASSRMLKCSLMMEHALVDMRYALSGHRCLPYYLLEEVHCRQCLYACAKIAHSSAKSTNSDLAACMRADVLPKVLLARANAVAPGHASSRAGCPVREGRPCACAAGGKAHPGCACHCQCHVPPHCRPWGIPDRPPLAAEAGAGETTRHL